MKHYATYSRSQDCFPANAPDTFISGKGCHVTAEDGREFIDFGMALRSVILGYCYPAVDEAAKKAIDKGVCFTRSNPYEGELREIITQDLKLGEKCKFGKNGSDATSNAIRLSRAYTGKKYVLIPRECPFFSTDSWFIGTTPVNDGILPEEYTYSKVFSYNNMTVDGTDIDDWISENKDVAAVIVDLATADNSKEKLQKIRDICTKHGVLLIMDEIITCFHTDLRGYQGLYGVKPDLSTYAKGMGNSYSISCVAGRKEIFDLGIRGKGSVFCASGTYFSETVGLSAAIACINELQNFSYYSCTGVKLTAWDYLKNIGSKIIDFIQSKIKEYNLETYVGINGFPSLPMMQWKTSEGLKAKTIFDTEMINQGICAPYWSPSLSHSFEDVAKTMGAIDVSLDVLKRVIFSGSFDEHIKAHCGNWVEKPVFRGK